VSGYKVSANDRDAISKKTVALVKTAQAQMIQDGHFRDVAHSVEI